MFVFTFFCERTYAHGGHTNKHYFLSFRTTLFSLFPDKLKLHVVASEADLSCRLRDAVSERDKAVRQGS